MGPNEIFRQNVIYLRRVHGLTKSQMAAILGISARTLSRLEAGEPVRMNAGMLIRLCDHFGLPADTCLRKLPEAAYCSLAAQ